VQPPERPPQLRTVMLIVAAYAVALASLSLGGGVLMQWWRSR
jgi:hypothetical protein